ncbi:MAG: bifunctional hydroxymethylpyrimidine kinase/phosphomethylpyrimidine kinase [Muribaculaceae bacterium]|nr:bifunctional hydroxymethylpyrimidine kinase/phosphomethylpyrimidine kinase [Muribaculaceae bacterium]
MNTLPKALTIAGSDPSGGAGVQADLKTFSALGVYGTTAIAALVDENTLGVYDIHPVPVRFVQGQIRSVLSDVGTDAIKIGMLHDSPLIEGVVSVLKEYPDIRNIVVDPVMVATSGDPLLEKDAVETLRSVLIPCARIITPNIPEASLLLGESIDSQNQLAEAAVRLSRMYGSNQVSVLLKAGHLDDERLIDIFYNAESGNIIRLESERVETENTHGTGCTLSSAVAAGLAKGMNLDHAVISAKEYLTSALTSGATLSIGKGHGPVHHFFSLWS